MMAASGTNGRSADGGLAFSGGADRVGFARATSASAWARIIGPANKPGGLRVLEQVVHRV
jgi:hypothetical protein